MQSGNILLARDKGKYCMGKKLRMSHDKEGDVLVVCPG
jgi:hypothetical protein